MAPRYEAPTPLMEGAFTTISSGLNHVCGLRTDGTVACEGSSEYGQQWPSEAKLPGGEGLVFEAINSGYEHTCAVEEGSIICYGIGAEAWETIPEEGITLSSLSGGAHYTCALHGDGSPFCWAIGGWELVWPEEKFIAISSGWLQACGLRNDQSAVCWQYFEATPEDRGFFLAEILNDYGVMPFEGEQFSSISAGYAFACGVRIDGSAVCWWPIDLERLLSEWQIYADIFDDRGQTAPPEGDRFTAISSGGLHACGLRVDGSVACWGSNDRGQIAPPEGSFAAISSGYDFTCGLREDGTVACWGSIQFG